MKTTVISLFGGPGSGKTTVSLGVSYELKKREINAELVREYVKKLAWQGIVPKKLDQLYISGQQSNEEYILYNKVKYIVTDCPLLQGPFYDIKYNNLNTTKNSVDLFLKNSNDITRLNFFVQRNKKYIKEGRFCSEESAKKTDEELKLYLKNNNIEYIQLNGTIGEQVEQVINNILSKED